MFELANATRMDGSGEVMVVAHGPVGMVTLKVDMSRKATRQQVRKITGALPGPRCIENCVAWMAPDELLIFTGQDPELLAARLESEIKTSVLAVNVSDARAGFTLKGKAAREVLAKGAPVDLSAEGFGVGDFRRTRMGQVAVAFWMEGPEEFRLVCASSVQEFMFEWLMNAARKDSLPAYL